MKHHRRMCKAIALLLMLTLVLGFVSTGLAEDFSGTEGQDESGWTMTDETSGAGTDAPADAGAPDDDAAPEAGGAVRLGATRGTQGYSSDLSDFLDSVSVAGAAVNDQGQYVIVQGTPYMIQMHFSEKIGGLQFDDTSDGGTLTYRFPNGFTPENTQGTVEMTGGGGVVRFDYVISGNTLTVTFDKDSPGYSTFITSETAQFEIHATGVIAKNEIAFSSEVSGRFDIDDIHEVTVEKSGAYDAALNKIRYTIQVHSEGSNTNVHVGDVVSGTALTLDPDSVTVSSDQANPVQYVADTRSGETFGLTIPAMAHGETVTVTYYADVDLSRLTAHGNGQYGTVEETGNTVRVTSNEDVPGDETTSYVNNIALSTNSKESTGQTVRDGKTYVTWRIILNENANISLAGQTVTDTIDPSCQAFMRYAGTGIHIEKRTKDGTLVGTDDIGWGTNGLSGGLGGSSWTYTIPASDTAAYRYVITYETEVDSDTLLIDTVVSNTVSNEYDSDHGGTSVGSTGDGVTATKTALESVIDAVNKEAETEWEIMFTVPAGGLNSAVVTDTMPGRRNNAEGIWYYDTYKDGSAYVVEGDLVAGEDYTVVSVPEDHQVKITFTRNGGEPGLSGTGLPRTIHIRLTSTASHDWLVYAESSSQARAHVNYAVIQVNGQNIEVTDSVSYNTTDYDLNKVQVGTYSTNTDPALPIYVYRINLTNVNDSVFDANGYITITDTYDEDYLCFMEQYPTDYTYEVNRPNGYVYGSTQWNPEWGIRGEYVVAQSAPAGQLVFQIKKDDLPMQGSSYYRNYWVSYALQVKDADTLARMQQEALHADGLKVEMANTASSDMFGENTIVTDYTLGVLEKKLVSESDNPSTGTHDLQFSIEVNPGGVRIGDEDTIIVKDTLTNLSFDYTSIEIEPRLDGDVINRTGSSIVMTLHNGTPYVVTYTARLIGIHDVNWNNTAELFGQTSGVSGESSSQSGGSGSYQVFSMNVMKYAQGNMTQGLAATFDLYEARVKDANGDDIPDAAWHKVGEFTTDPTTGLFRIQTVIREGSTEGQSLRPYSYHDDAGVERFGTSGSEAYGWRYRIIETAAPEGYQKTDIAYEFGISDIPSYTAPYNYLNGDTVTVVNTPVPSSVDVVIPGTKVLVGKELEDKEFTFSLTPEDSALAGWGEGYPGGFVGSLTAQNDADGHFHFTLKYTYDDYVSAVNKGLVDADQRASFRYVVREVLPEGAGEGQVHNGVKYDENQYLVTVRLSVDGDQMVAETDIQLYDGNGVAGT